MSKSAASQQVEADLGALVERGVVVDYKGENPTGNKLVWLVNLSDAAKAAIGEFDTNAMSTPEVKAFVAGAAAGATGAKVKQARALKPNKLRDAIAKDGRVEYKVKDPSNQGEMKKARNMLFSLAYTLGYKGEFTVKTQEGGVLVGEVKAEAFQAKP